MTTELSTLFDGELTLGRLRVIAGRMGLPQDQWSHLPQEEETRQLTEYLIGLLDALERHHMTIEQYVRVVDSRRVPDGVLPFARRRGGVR